MPQLTVARPRWSALAALVVAAAVTLAACSTPAHRPPLDSSTSPAGVQASGPGVASSATPSPGGPPRPDHVLVVVFENKSYAQVAAARQASWFHRTMSDAAVFTNAHGVAHPSQPNYVALFSGSTHSITDDHCPVDLTGQPNLGRQLLDAGRSFVGYSEGLPKPGYLGCSHDGYAAKHNPWVDFDNVPAAANQPFSAFPTDFARLPTVSFVVPDLCHDMHDCSIGTGDAWASQHLTGYLQWAQQHNSLLIVTFDENDNSSGNQILTFFAGAGVRPGRYGQRVDHYRVLRTIEGFYGLSPLGRAAATTPISGIWS